MVMDFRFHVGPWRPADSQGVEEGMGDKEQDGGEKRLRLGTRKRIISDGGSSETKKHG